MITNENKKLAQWAMEYALKNGCQSSRVTLYNGSSSSFEIRDMKIDRLQQASENSMVVHLFVDGRYGSYSTNRLDKKELEKFIKDGIAATRFLAEDKARTLPDASLYYKGGAADLRLVDPNFDSVQPDDKVALAMSVCEEIMGKDDRIISANASYSDEKDFKYMVASNGFEGEASGSSYGLVGSVSIRGEGDARPESYWYDSSLYYEYCLHALQHVLHPRHANTTQTEHAGSHSCKHFFPQLHLHSSVFLLLQIVCFYYSMST